MERLDNQKSGEWNKIEINYERVKNVTLSRSGDGVRIIGVRMMRNVVVRTYSDQKAIGTRD